MKNGQGDEQDADDMPDNGDSNVVRPRTISLPKGGGVIWGMGEKVAANPTGNGSLAIPIAISPGHLRFDTQLALSYDSSAGNTPFGFGWYISIPTITRRTNKGLSRYLETSTI